MGADLRVPGYGAFVWCPPDGRLSWKDKLCTRPMPNTSQKLAESPNATNSGVSKALVKDPQFSLLYVSASVDILSALLCEQANIQLLLYTT